MGPRSMPGPGPSVPSRHQSAESIQRLLRLLDPKPARAAGKPASSGAGLSTGVYRFTPQENVRPSGRRHQPGGPDDRDRSAQTFRPKTRKSAARIPIADPLAKVLGLWLPVQAAGGYFRGRIG